jgi:hypothetical protein
VRFWDSSGLVPLALSEPASSTVEHILRQDTSLAIWWGTPVECASALERAIFEKTVDRTALQAARRIIQGIQIRAFEVQPLEGVRLRAVRLLGIHRLRAADAFQLAAALVWCGDQPIGADFVCLDDRLREAALREGFTVLPEH